MSWTHHWALPAAPAHRRRPTTPEHHCISAICVKLASSQAMENRSCLFVGILLWWKLHAAALTTRRYICNGVKQGVYLTEQGRWGAEGGTAIRFTSKCTLNLRETSVFDSMPPYFSHVDTAHRSVSSNLCISFWDKIKDLTGLLFPLCT